MKIVDYPYDHNFRLGGDIMGHKELLRLRFDTAEQLEEKKAWAAKGGMTHGALWKRPQGDFLMFCWRE